MRQKRPFVWRRDRSSNYLVPPGLCPIHAVVFDYSGHHQYGQYSGRTSPYSGGYSRRFPGLTFSKIRASAHRYARRPRGVTPRGRRGCRRPSVRVFSDMKWHDRYVLVFIHWGSRKITLSPDKYHHTYEWLQKQTRTCFKTSRRPR